MIQWKQLDDRELLKLNINKFDFRPQDHPQIKKAILQLTQELRHKDIPFSPYYWVSDEWFCPDGHSGVAIPLFLLNQRLRKLEKIWVGNVEGGSYEELMKLLRHEVGHAIDNAFALRKNKKRQLLFGSSERRYPISFRPKPYSSKCVRHLGFGYAQSHPDEDFAETFAVWLKYSRVHWEKTYCNTSAHEKLKFMDDLMRSLKGTFPAKQKLDRPVDLLGDFDLSLKDYFIKRRQKHNLIYQISCRRSLMSFFVSPKLKESRTMLAHRFLLKFEAEAVRKVSRGLGLYQYEVRQVMRPMVELVKNKRLTIRTSYPQSKMAFLDFLTEQCLKCIQQGALRVSL